MGSRVDVDLQFDMWVCVREHSYFNKVKSRKEIQRVQKFVCRTSNDLFMTYESEIQTKLGCAVMLNSAFGVWDIE